MFADKISRKTKIGCCIIQPVCRLLAEQQLVETEGVASGESDGFCASSQPWQEWCFWTVSSLKPRDEMFDIELNTSTLQNISHETGVNDFSMARSLTRAKQRAFVAPTCVRSKASIGSNRACGCINDACTCPQIGNSAEHVPLYYALIRHPTPQAVDVEFT